MIDKNVFVDAVSSKISKARGLCERSQTLVFGRSTRDDLSKLFLGKDAVAYITSRTPGPGAYELAWQRPFSLFPAREPGPTIGGPLANVDRVQTGPLGPSYRSFTPGPGAYDDDHDRGVRTAPPRRSRRSGGGGGYSTRYGCSTSSHTRASTSGSLTSESAEAYRPVRVRRDVTYSATDILKEGGGGSGERDRTRVCMEVARYFVPDKISNRCGNIAHFIYRRK